VGVRVRSSLKSSTRVVNRPTRGSARRVAIGCSGSGRNDRCWPISRLRVSGSQRGTVGAAAPVSAASGDAGWPELTLPVNQWVWVSMISALSPPRTAVTSELRRSSE
jgi:hypothetical protein